MSSETVTRAHLADALYMQVGISHAEAADFVDGFFAAVAEGVLQDQVVKLPLFGSFRAFDKSARVGRNPKTKEEVVILPRRVVRFYPARSLKSALHAAQGVGEIKDEGTGDNE